MIKLITREGCTSCNTIKTVFKQHGVDYEEYIIGTNINREEVLAQYPGRKNLPIIDLTKNRSQLPKAVLDKILNYIWIPDNE